VRNPFDKTMRHGSARPSHRCVLQAWRARYDAVEKVLHLTPACALPLLPRDATATHVGVPAASRFWNAFRHIA